MNELQAMIYPTTLIRRPDDDGKAASQNEMGWDISLFRVGAAEAAKEAAVPPSNEESMPLDDFLSGEHHKYPFGFTISIPSSYEHERKLSLPVAMPSEYEQTNEDEGSCDKSIVSELTQMTYHAELMKQVSSEVVLIMCIALIPAANYLSFSSSSMMMQAISIEFEKFRQQKKQQGVEAHPEAIRRMFHRTIACPDTQESMTSFVNINSVKMKAEARQHHHLEEVEEEHDAASDPTIQRRIDELFVEFGVRPARSVPCEIPEENTTKTRPSNDEQRAVTDYHLDSVIQLKLQLAEKQASIEELSSKYNALSLENSWQDNMLAENSSLREENERLRAQLHQAGITSAAPTGHQRESSSFNLADSKNRPTPPPSPNQPSHTFNIDDKDFHEVDTKKVDVVNSANQAPTKHQEYTWFGTKSTATDRSSTTNESPPSQPSPKPLNSFSNIFQSWTNRPTTTMAMELSDGVLHRSFNGHMAGSNTKSSDTSQRRRGNRRGWKAMSMLERPPPSL